jgi:hypothetical protein
MLPQAIADMLDEDAVVFHEFDNCAVGVVIRFGQDPVICYDYNYVIAQLMQDMSEEDAVEHFHFNIIGAYIGKQTPFFIVRPDTDV